MLTILLRPARRPRPALAPALLTAALAALAPPAPAASLEESATREETLAFAPGAAERVLRVCNVEGDVSARGHDGAEVRLSVRETYRGETPADLERARERLDLRIEREAGAIEIAVGAPCDCRRDCHDRRDGGRWGARHDFEIEVPRGVRVELRTVNGGAVTLRDHRGDFRLANVNGPVRALDVAGSGSAATVNGDLEVRFAENPRAETSFTNVNGRIDVTFRPGLAAELAFKTFNGEVYTDLALEDSPGARASRDPRRGTYALRRRWRTRSAAGAGGAVAELSFATVNGDIYLRGPAS